MTGSPIPPDDGLLSLPIDEGLLIARPTDDRLFLFNDAARFIWERLVDGAPESQLPGLIAARYGIDIARACSDFDDTLRQWRERGLVRPRGSHRRYEIAGLPFDIRCNDADVAAALASLLSHLTAETAHPPMLEIDVDCCGGAIVLRADGVETNRPGDRDALIATLLTDLFRFASERASWVMSLHGAAVGISGACVLMPGASGSGKSTLSAALLSFDDMRLIADDLALLAGERLDVLPVPLPMALKSEGWDALQTILPDLVGRPVHHRHGKDCRYWTPPRERIAREPTPVKAIVFPRYVPAAETRLTPIAAFESLSRITSAPSAVRAPITSVTLEAVAGFARNIPAFTLTYGAVVEARWAVRELLTT